MENFQPTEDPGLCPKVCSSVFSTKGREASMLMLIMETFVLPSLWFLRLRSTNVTVYVVGGGGKGTAEDIGYCYKARLLMCDIYVILC